MSRSEAPGGGRFPPTRWTLVWDAQQDERGDGDSRRALEELCRLYWEPLYAFIRRSGFGHEDAEDLVQSFLARVLTHNLLENVSADRGKLRTWLLALLKPFLLDRRKYDRARKRGGGSRVVSIDAGEAERRYNEEPAHTLTPDAVYDRRWAVSVMARALESLARDYRAAQQEDLFAELSPHLQWQGDGDCSYAESAARLGMSEGAVKVAVYRLRRRYRESLSREVADTLGPGEDLDAEIRHLFSVFGD